MSGVESLDSIGYFVGYLHRSRISSHNNLKIIVMEMLQNSPATEMVTLMCESLPSTHFYIHNIWNCEDKSFDDLMNIAVTFHS